MTSGGSGGPGGSGSEGSVGRIVLDDAEGYADLRTFVTRARSLDEEGSVRLQADGTVLAAYVGVLPGRGLMGDGAVVGLRTMRLAAAVQQSTRRSPSRRWPTGWPATRPTGSSCPRSSCRRRGRR